MWEAPVARDEGGGALAASTQLMPLAVSPVPATSTQVD